MLDQELANSAACLIDARMTDPCPVEAIEGLTTEEAIQLLEIEIYMRHTLSKKLRDKLILLYVEKQDLESCLDNLRNTRLRMDKLVELCHTPCILYNPVGD